MIRVLISPRFQASRNKKTLLTRAHKYKPSPMYVTTQNMRVTNHDEKGLGTSYSNVESLAKRREQNQNRKEKQVYCMSSFNMQVFNCRIIQK